MKKLVMVLAALVLLTIMACSSGGDNVIPPQQTLQQSVVIEPSSETTELSDGAKVTFDAGLVNAATTAVIKKYDSSPTSVGDATQLSPTYEIEIPIANIADLANDDSDFTTFITFEIPVQTSLRNIASKALIFSSIPDDAYKVSNVVIDYTSDKLQLFGNYVVQGEKTVVRVSKSTIAKVKQKATDAKVKIQVTILNVKSYFNIGEKLYKVTGTNLADDFKDVTSLGLSDQMLGGKTPLVLIHGWQQGLDKGSKNPHKTLWQNFINYFYSSAELQQKYVLYSYRYDSDHSIDENAQRLGEIINDCFGDAQKIVILAHSMGGLISHYYIQKNYNNGASRVLRLVTLGTPYHGSPLVQLGLNETMLTAQQGIATSAYLTLALGTPGTLDLKWDNFDANPSILSGNSTLLKLNTDMRHQELYFAFGGKIETPSAHGISYENYYKKNEKLSYASNDAIVPLVSAFNNGHPAGFNQIGPMVDYDHSQMAQGRTGDTSDPLFTQIKNVLVTEYTISGQVTYNGTGLAGVNVTLTREGNSAVAVTDANGVYTFIKATNGTYTLTFAASGYSFDPSTKSITVNGENVLIVNNIIATAAAASAAVAQWAKTVMAGNSGSYLEAVSVASDGSVYVAGYVSGIGTYDFGNSVTAAGTSNSHNIILVKYNSSGVAQWAKTVNTGKDSEFRAVSVASDGSVYAAGYIWGAYTYDFGNSVTATGSGYNDSILLVKYNSSGVAQWAKNVNTGESSEFRAVSVASDGSVYATGYIRGAGTHNFGNNVTATVGDIASTLLVKYNSSGVAQWAQTAVVGNSSIFSAVSVASDGSVYVAGSIQGTVDFGNSVTATGSDNNYCILLVKYNSSGVAQWAKSELGDSDFYAVSVAPDGSVFAAGDFYGPGTHNFGNGVTATGTAVGNNILLVKYNSSGIAQWAKTVTAADTQSGFYGVSVASDGSVFAAGYIAGYAFGEIGTFDFGNSVTATGYYMTESYTYPKIILVKYNSSGVAQWAKTVTSNNSYPSTISDVSVALDGSIYAAGFIYRGIHDFGNSVTATATNATYNMLLVKYY